MSHANTKVRLHPRIARLEAYNEGRDAYLMCEPSEANPYPSQAGHSDNRIAWFSGWYDAKLQVKFGIEPDHPPLSERVAAAAR